MIIFGINGTMKFGRIKKTRNNAVEAQNRNFGLNESDANNVSSEECVNTISRKMR